VNVKFKLKINANLVILIVLIMSKSYSNTIGNTQIVKLNVMTNRQLG